MWIKTIHLGPEHDPDLRDALSEALHEAGAVPLWRGWALAGQEVETAYHRVGVRLLRVRAETYVGLTIRGPTRLVERIAARVGALRAAGPAIRITAWPHPPELAAVLGLAGQVVATCVDVPADGTPIPFFEFLRLARVRHVAHLPEPARCARCESDGRCHVHVQWESGYLSPDGDILCEHCIVGRVTSGADTIEFLPAPA